MSTFLPEKYIKDALRPDWGFWESKDESDNIDEEIKKKFLKGYPNDKNLLKNPETFKKGGRTISKSAQLFNEQERQTIIPTTNSTTSLKTPKAKLKADRERGTIILDEATELHDISPEAWDYKLGNRSALECILDQYKEKTPRNPTIREKFNTYRFADYKQHVIGLLKRVTTVSVRTTQIVREMSAE